MGKQLLLIELTKIIDQNVEMERGRENVRFDENFFDLERAISTRRVWSMAEQQLPDWDHQAVSDAGCHF
jgi:hypothetical protein